MARGYQSWSDDQTYFADQVWSHHASCVSKSCISTGNILLYPEFIHTRSDTSRSLRHRQRSDRLDRGSVRRIHCPVKMAAGHLPTSSHNFAWRGVINHDRTTKLTLQTKYDHTMLAVYPKVAYPLEIPASETPEFIHTRSDTSRSLRHRQRSDRPSSRRCLPWRHHRVTWITWPPLWRSPHSPDSEIFIAPEQYIFHSDGERR